MRWPWILETIHVEILDGQPHPFFQMILQDIGKDARKPGATVRIRVKCPPVLPGPEECVLNEVVGVDRWA